MTDGGFAHTVARPDAAGHHDRGGEAGAVELHGVVEPGLQDGRRPAVVLGGSEHDDRIGGTALIEPANPPHPAEQDAVQDQCHGAQPETPGPRPLHNSNDSPSCGMTMSRTPSSLRICAMAAAGAASPCTTNARLTGPPRALTQARSSVRSAWAESPEMLSISARTSWGSPKIFTCFAPSSSRRPRVFSAWNPTKRTQLRESPMWLARWCRIRPDSAIPDAAMMMAGPLRVF